VETLTKKGGENVGIILDGIDGMFSCCPQQEIATILQRKGIVKIALKAGVPLVPVYGFGHTSLWTIVVDPLGILQYASQVLGISLVPFFGCFGWFLGPPRRVAVAVCLGEPVRCPRVDNPTQAEIEKYHQELLHSYTELFDTHKAAYGWQHKTLKFVYDTKQRDCPSDKGKKHKHTVVGRLVRYQGSFTGLNPLGGRIHHGKSENSDVTFSFFALLFVAMLVAKKQLCCRL
jgi:Diacylglycerol acyltransferase